MKFEIEINESQIDIMTSMNVSRDIEGLIKSGGMFAQPGSGAYSIHRIVPGPASEEFDKLLTDEG